VTALFLACAALGGIVVVAQLVLGILGLHHDAPHDLGTSDTADAFQLFSVRALAAGVLFFGLAGYASSAQGLAPWAALVAAGVAGGVATVSVAALMRAVLRLEDDGVVRIERAVGLPATVYTRVPGGRSGAGKVLLTLQSRTVEYQAVTARHDLPAGAAVILVDVVGPDTVEVVPTPTDGEIFDASP
jgi:hypothetical protein